MQQHLEEEESQPTGRTLKLVEQPHRIPLHPNTAPLNPPLALSSIQALGCLFFRGGKKFNIIIFKSISHKSRKKFVAKLNNTTNTAHHRVELAEPVPTPLKSSTFTKKRPRYPHSRILPSPSWSFRVFVNKDSFRNILVSKLVPSSSLHGAHQAHYRSPVTKFCTTGAQSPSFPQLLKIFRNF